MQEAFWFTGDDHRSWTPLTRRARSPGLGGRFDPVAASLAHLAGGVSFDSLLRVTDGARHVTSAGRLVCPNLLGLTFTDVDHGLDRVQLLLDVLPRANGRRRSHLARGGRRVVT